MLYAKGDHESVLEIMLEARYSMRILGEAERNEIYGSGCL